MKRPLIFIIFFFAITQMLLHAQTLSRSNNTTTADGPAQPTRVLPLPQTRVQFRTSNSLLQNVFDEAEKTAKSNHADFGKYKVMVEGGRYKRVFLETQPMGGCMYAKRDVEIARNNQLIFMDLQREDGRLASAIGYNKGQLTPLYSGLQGNYLPLEAFDVYYWIGKDREYLKKLYNTLVKFDNYLWKTRDSDHNGCLESWCAGDTGEDSSTRFGKAYHHWMFDYAPTHENLKNMSKEDATLLCKANRFTILRVNNNLTASHDELERLAAIPIESMTTDLQARLRGDVLEYDSPMPMESMDMMSYSFANRAILAQISEILQNGQSEYWHSKALDVQKKLKEYLWIPERHACFDKDKNNKVMDILTHNNLRCMYFGSFDQEMADQFVKYHLMNPKEFWTPMPLPSIAANDPAFRNIPGNNFSGRPQGLTYQRSIRALENYGHYAELTLIGEKYLKVIGDSLKFTQQFDPFKATIDNNLEDGYGPSVLASLEFISRLYGIHISRDKVYWSCLDDQQSYEYSQEWDNRWYQMATKGDRVICSVNGKEVLSFTKGIRVVTDGNGEIIEAIGISTKDQKAIIEFSGKTFSLTVAPNAIYGFTNKFQESKKVEFYRPDSFLR